jgi:hypothetical protein
VENVNVEHEATKNHKRSKFKMATLSLEQRIEYLEAVHEIENLMGKYELYLSAGKFHDLLDLYAPKTPGVSLEVGEKGVHEGLEGVREYADEHSATFGSDGQGTGWLAEHNLTSHVIQVAGDGKTAKGVWAVPGLHGGVDKKTGEGRATWSYEHLAAHFVKEDGQWKVWKFHGYSVFNTPYDQGWGKIQWNKRPVPLVKERAGTYHRPYSLTQKPEYRPAAPEPYDTYDPNTPLP